MSTDTIKRIIEWNKKAGLLSKGYDDQREASFQIEEALEGFPMLSEVQGRLLISTKEVLEVTPKEVSRTIVKVASINQKEPLADVDRFDKHLDGMVYHIGSLAKLGLTAEQIVEGWNIVMNHNDKKLACKQDDYGKLGKPKVFEGPEAELQEILDKRK